jgi:predicted secreted Zn-dependent protease
MKANLIVALLAAGVFSPASAANVAKTYSYFPVGGSTLKDIQKQLDTRGPEVRADNHRHPGAVQLIFVSRISYQNSRRGCAIAAATVTVKAKIILPHWRGRRPADPGVRLVWDTLSADIKRHEETHVMIAKNHAWMLEQALLAIRRQPDCEAAVTQAMKVTEKVLAKHNAAQAEFDRIEGVTWESRMVRLLRYRIELMAGSQKPG